MSIKMVLFDLDGTLLPMDMDEFTMGYFKMLAAKAAPHGYELKSLIKVIWHGVSAMVANDGHCTNEEAFWEDFASIYGKEALKDQPIFNEFYANEFQGAKIFCGFNPQAAETVRWIKDQPARNGDNLRIALATNPLFPSVATESRIRWTGLEPDEFELYTTYENIGWCKPNLDYYREVLRRVDLQPEECLMVDNDVGEDMIAEELGMRVFLITDCLINKDGVDISRYPNGTFEDLREYISKLIEQ